jgi:dinuclear metal center YbgI/SA1388 family protein
MTKLNTIVRFLNREVKIKSIKDGSINGLQVKASSEIGKVGLATDACMDVFEKAKKLKCDLVIVHHGLFWKKQQKDMIFLIKKKVEFLKKNKISVYAAHLPLDKHLKHGNNSNLLRMLNVRPKEIFGEVGYLGYFEKYREVNSIVKELERKLKTKCKVWKFGKAKIKKIAIVSGYGATSIAEAVKKNVDLFIVGEASHGSYLSAKDGKLSMIIAGHYKTETFGVKALGNLLEKKFNLKTVFIDNPTGM